MKKLIYEHAFDFDIDVEVRPYSKYVAASEMYGIPIPDGDLMPETKDELPTDQMIADYEDFIEAIEDLLQDHYGLILVYKSKSEDYSKYYNFLACDKDGVVLFRFRLRLRVSTHDAHRTKQSQKHKKEEEHSEKLLELLDGRPLPKAYPKTVIVNRKTFTSYEEAFVTIDNDVKRWINVMIR